MKFRVRIAVPVVLLSWTQAFSESPSEHEMGDCIGYYWDAVLRKAMIRNSILEGLIVFGVVAVLGMLLIVITRYFKK